MMKTLVSIGANCRVRYQIDQFLQKNGRKDEISWHVFDRLMGGNLEGAINIIERDFIMLPEDIYIAEHEGKFVPGDRNSNFLFFHDFGIKHKFSDSREECESALALAFDASMRKYRYLGRKTAELLGSEKEVCLLFYGRSTEASFMRLRDVLRRKFGKEIMIVNVLDREDGPDGTIASVTTVFVDEDKSPKRGTPHEWEGWDESWEAAFALVC
jgi:hypothetical protein